LFYKIFILCGYPACDLYKVDMPPEMQEKQKQKTIKQAYRFLISVGGLSAGSLVQQT